MVDTEIMNRNELIRRWRERNAIMRQEETRLIARLAILREEIDQSESWIAHELEEQRDENLSTQGNTRVPCLG